MSTIVLDGFVNVSTHLFLVFQLLSLHCDIMILLGTPFSKCFLCDDFRIVGFLALHSVITGSAGHQRYVMLNSTPLGLNLPV